jgi:hypothetical protein
LGEPLRIYIAKFKLIAKGDSTSQVKNVEESLLRCGKVITLFSCETKKEGWSDS